MRPGSSRRSRCAQREHAGGGAPGAGDAELVGEGQHILTVGVVGTNSDRGAGQVGAVAVGDRQRRGDRGGGPFSLQARVPPQLMTFGCDVRERAVLVGRRCRAHQPCRTTLVGGGGAGSPLLRAGETP